MNAETEIGRRLRAIESRMEAACLRAGRRRSEVTLVGASKRQPVESLQAAYDAGLRVFGENRVQEVAAKAPALPETTDWHLIGPLQSNKVRRAVGLCSTIHSVDRIKIARAIDRVAAELAVTRLGLLEVNVAEEESKHGFGPEQLVESATALAELSSLEIVGVMAIPPLGAEPEQSRPWFRRLRLLRDRLSDLEVFQSWRGWLSMGMSSDFEIAIEEGATHVRVGTDLFGAREPVTT